MGWISEACKEQIRNRVPLEELLREYNVTLSPVGKRLRALCPFHAEKTPSFYVDIERQTYHCFGCQEHGDLFRFVQRMIGFRKARRTIARSRFWREDVHWYGCDGPPDLGVESRSLAYCLDGERVGEGNLYVMINAHVEPRRFMIQEGAPGQWRRVVDTGRPSPEDFAEPGAEPEVGDAFYEVGPRSVVVLTARG